jgi:hypothetical protein
VNHSGKIISLPSVTLVNGKVATSNNSFEGLYVEYSD